MESDVTLQVVKQTDGRYTLSTKQRRPMTIAHTEAFTNAEKGDFYQAIARLMNVLAAEGISFDFRDVD